MAAGGQLADGYSAVLGSRDVSVCEAAGIRHSCFCHSGMQNSNGAAILRLEAEACALGAGVEQNVMLRVELPRLVLRDGCVHAVQIHVGLDGAAVRADIHDKHARQLRPDGGEAIRGGSCLGVHAVHKGHRVIRHQHNCCACLLGLHHGDVAVQLVRRDAHDVAGIAVHIDDLIVHLRQRDLGVHSAFDREPVAEGIELERLTDGHVLVALGVDVQVDARAVIDVVFKVIDRVLAELAIQAEICLCDRVSRVVAQLDIVPIGRALRMTDTVEVIRVLVEVERRRGAVFSRLIDRLKEGVHIVIRERTGVDGRARRRSDLDRDKFLAFQTEIGVYRRGLGSGSRVEIGMLVLIRRSRHADRIAEDKQTACLKCAVVVSCAKLRLAIRAGSIGDAQREGIVRVLDPGAGADGDLIHPLQLEAVVFTADVDRYAAVAILFRVIAVDPVSAGRKVDGVRAVCGRCCGQQIVRALCAVCVGIQLQGLDLRVKQTGQRDADLLVLCRQNACGQQTQQHHEHEQQAQNSFLHTSFLQSQNIYRKLLLYVGAETGGADVSGEKNPPVLYRHKTADDSLWNGGTEKTAHGSLECESRARPTHSSLSPQNAALTAVLLTCTLETESLSPRPFPAFSRKSFRNDWLSPRQLSLLRNGLVRTAPVEWFSLSLAPKPARRHASVTVHRMAI